MDIWPSKWCSRELGEIGVVQNSDLKGCASQWMFWLVQPQIHRGDMSRAEVKILIYKIWSPIYAVFSSKWDCLQGSLACEPFSFFLGWKPLFLSVFWELSISFSHTRTPAMAAANNKGLNRHWSFEGSGGWVGEHKRGLSISRKALREWENPSTTEDAFGSFM